MLKLTNLIWFSLFLSVLFAENSHAQYSETQTEYAQECLGGSFEYCNAYLSRVSTGSAHNLNTDRPIIEMVERICLLDNSRHAGKACRALGKYYSFDLSRKTAVSDATKSVDFFERGCFLQDAGSCSKMSFFFQIGVRKNGKSGPYVVTPNLSKAAKFEEQSCLIGYSTAFCIEWANWILEGKGTNKSKINATLVLSNACRFSRQFDMCKEVVKWSVEGKGSPSGIERAINVLEMGCSEWDSSEFCFELARWYLDGNWIERDLQRAFLNAQKGCSFAQGKITSDCSKFALDFLEGNERRNVVADVEKGLQLAGPDCLAGNSFLCRTVGMYYYNGDQVEQDYGQARRFFEHGCGLGDVSTCLDLVASYHQGQDGFPKDSKAAGIFLATACQFDVTKESCKLTLSDFSLSE